MSAFLKRQQAQTLNILNGMLHQAGERSQIEAQRSDQRAFNAREEMHEQSHQSYMRAVAENTVLREELAKRDQELLEQKDLVAYWANGNEAYRRTIQHLCQFWAPQENSPDTVSQEAKEANLAQAQNLVNQKINELAEDPEWPEKLNKVNSSRVKKRRQRNGGN